MMRRRRLPNGRAGSGSDADKTQWARVIDRERVTQIGGRRDGPARGGSEAAQADA
jgi:hypothetical protein